MPPKKEGQGVQPSGRGAVCPARLAGQTRVKPMVTLVIRKLLRVTDPRSGAAARCAPLGLTKNCRDELTNMRRRQAWRDAGLPGGIARHARGRAGGGSEYYRLPPTGSGSVSFSRLATALSTSLFTGLMTTVSPVSVSVTPSFFNSAAVSWASDSLLGVMLMRR